MKVTAFVGSARKKHTYDACKKFLANLESMGDVKSEIVRLSDYYLKICTGCKLCCDKGEELCPLKDDRDKLVEKMLKSDGVIFATLNYTFSVSGLMKVFLDRLAYVCHRPRFFGKTFTSIVAQGIFGGEKIIKYFNFIGNPMGFNVVKGSCIRSLEPMSGKTEKKNNEIIKRHSRKFYSQLVKKEFRTPSLLELMIFRMARSSWKLMLDESFRDHTYAKEKGWFESDFYYPVKLDPFKKTAGKFFDAIGAQLMKKK